ncbi:hypothetical protein DFH09DRAFT_1326393 [Mycena vulgaris]|nr:hypothetical protein DFH09DRAFT_1326393 [Mycena vulgaris]
MISGHTHDADAPRTAAARGSAPLRSLLFPSPPDTTPTQALVWSLARNQNAAFHHDLLLAPLRLPFPRLAIPFIPLAPGPGAPVNTPPLFVPPALAALPAHVLFPATLFDLRVLTLAGLAILFVAYSIPPPIGPVAVQRAEFARHIGVIL